MTALMYAADENNAEVVKVLLKGRADVHARDNFGKTALMYAAECSPNPEVVKVLLKNGADVRAADKNGHDALWHALDHNEKGGYREETIRLLKEYASSGR